MPGVIRCWPALPKSVINPNIYGHFAEHLGRCIYEGIWVGQDRRVPNKDGMRLDVLAALSHLRAPVVRWPGGCFADDYHWRDGLGPVGERPQTANLWWRQMEPNAFGTDEFLRFCEAIGAAAYLCANVGSGSPREAREWVEYCNFQGDSSLAALRAKHGRARPWNVRYWGVGNENWGCGGAFTGSEYAGEYARFATYMRAASPDIKLFACGASFGNYKNGIQNDWNHDFCQRLSGSNLVDCLSLHRYFSRGRAEHFSDAEYHALFADALSLERDLELTEAMLRYFFPQRHVEIAVDEWGMWHPEAVADNGLEQPHTLRDALMAATVLHVFNRWSHRVSMANIAQTVNVLQCLAVTRDETMFLTPTYHVFDMMRPHRGATTLTLETEGPSFDARPTGFDRKQAVPALDACASRSGKKILLTVVNKSLDDGLETRIELREAAIAAVTGKVLCADSPRSVNTFDDPSRVVSRRIRPTFNESEFIHVFPPHSFTALSLTLV